MRGTGLGYKLTDATVKHEEEIGWGEHRVKNPINLGLRVEQELNVCVCGGGGARKGET